MPRNNGDNVRVHIYVDPDTKRRLAALANEADESLNAVAATILAVVAKAGRVGLVSGDGQLVPCHGAVTIGSEWQRNIDDSVTTEGPVLEVDIRNKRGKWKRATKVPA